MKKIFYKVAQTGAFTRVLAVALLIGIAAGCGDDDDPAKRGKSSNEGGTTALIGTWYTTLVSSNDYSVEFLSDNSLRAGGVNPNVTWSASGGKIKFQITSGGTSLEIGTADYVIEDGSLTILDITGTQAGGSTVVSGILLAANNLSLPVTYIKGGD
ncbi:hypothetical protein AGMMS49982_17640 [Bacteroidia bacterium]|nr:hypothetical protein AGMMS49982_17640 [Bacteroidia bacterium]